MPTSSSPGKTLRVFNPAATARQVGCVVAQVRMSTEGGDWGSMGGQVRMDEDGTMPAFSDPCRDAKNSPTQSNFSAPDNLQGGCTPLLCLCQRSTTHLRTGHPALLVPAPGTPALATLCLL